MKYMSVFDKYQDLTYNTYTNSNIILVHYINLKIIPGRFDISFLFEVGFQISLSLFLQSLLNNQLHSISKNHAVYALE